MIFASASFLPARGGQCHPPALAANSSSQLRLRFPQTGRIHAHLHQGLSLRVCVRDRALKSRATRYAATTATNTTTPNVSASTPSIGSLQVLSRGETCTAIWHVQNCAQFLRRQRPATSGRIMPNPCGSRLCAANYGGRTLQRNWSSRRGVAIERVALGHRETARLRSTSSLCCSTTQSAGDGFSNTPRAATTPNGAESCRISSHCSGRGFACRVVEREAA